MHGSPLLRALFVFLAILALGAPLRQLTHQSTAAETSATPVVSEAAEKDIHLQLTFTQLPASFRVLSLGKEIWNETMPKPDMERDLKLAYPKEGIDLEFQIHWTGDALAAARVRLTDPDGRQMEKTVWGTGDAEEVLTFP